MGIGDIGPRAEPYGVTYRPEESTPGEEWARCIGGGIPTIPLADKGLSLLCGEPARGLEGVMNWDGLGLRFVADSKEVRMGEAGDGEGKRPCSSSSGERGSRIISAANGGEGVTG